MEEFYPSSEDHPSISVVGYIVKKEEKLTLFTNNREHVLPSGFTWQRGLTQNNELLIQIA